MKTSWLRKWGASGQYRCLLLASCLVAAFSMQAQAAAAAPDVEDIIARNIAARGGLQAWKNVQALSFSGEMDAGKLRALPDASHANPHRMTVMTHRSKARLRHEAKLKEDANPDVGKVVQLPFEMELKRPRKMRLEVRFHDMTAVQTYDGTSGWKLRPFLNKSIPEPFTADEVKVAAQQQELDGFLIDHAAKGTQVALEGTEKIEGRDAYKLKLTLKTGDVRHVWVDAQTFLEVRVDGSRRMDGKWKTVLTAMRDYRPVDGLMLPHLLETWVEGSQDVERIVVSGVKVNPALADARFDRPQ